MTQILSKKLSGGSQERDSQVADLSFKNCILGQKTGIFGLKKLWNKFKTAKRREPVVTFDAQLGFLVSTSSLRPSNSRICPGNGPKRPPEAPKCRQPHTATQHTPARSGGVQGRRAHKHAHTQTPQPGAAGRSRNPSPSTHTHTARPSQEWRGTSGARPQTQTHPNTPARSGGAQPKPEPKHTHPHRTAHPGVAGYKRNTHTNTHTSEHPSQAWRGAAETRPQAHTPTPHTPARSGGVQAERTQKHTHTPTAQPGMAGRSRNPSPHTHTHTAHPSQDWRGTSGARPHTHTHLNTPARRGGAQPKPEPNHTHPHRTPQPGVAEYKRSAPTNTHTPQDPSQEWRGAAETGAKPHAPTPHTPARSGGVQTGRAHKHTHTPTPQPGVAGRSQNPSPSTHTHAEHPSLEWRGTAGARTQPHTPQNPSQKSRGASQNPSQTAHTRNPS